ncbi:MAG TPA: O-antigen ligase family protein [Candidatus Polarisedimenticolaceae bacterium]|nr:O-antigen ligase family protein [Candidatus Polarisedimenticolaceae bacterium]
MRNIASWIVAVLVGVAALAFGSVERWSGAWLLFGAVVAAAIALWNVEPRRVFSGAAFAPILPAVLLVLWGAFQSLPLPRPVTRLLTPRTSRLQETTIPEGGGRALPSWLLAQAPAHEVNLEPGASLPPGPDDEGERAARSSLSIDPGATRRACLAWLAPLLLVVVAERLSRDPSTRYRLLWAVAVWTGLLGAIAVAQRVAWNGRLLWFRETPPDAEPLGPFVNPNHFAGYVEMGVLVVIGLLLAILGGGDGRLTRGNVRAALLDRSWSLPRLLVLFGITVLALCGMVLSGSRGGAIAFVAGIAVLVPSRKLRGLLAAATVVVLVVGLAVGLASWLGPDVKTLQTGLFAENLRDPSFAMRSDIWGRTWQILADHPATGTGLGTFARAYATYDREGEWLGTRYAHNDFLQLASETGIVGAGLSIWLLVAVGWRVLLPALRPVAPARTRWTTAGLAAAVFAMLVHSVVDFSLQIPAVAALFAVLAGMLVAAAADPAPAVEEPAP